MDMTSVDARALKGVTVYGSDGGKIGKIEDIYLDDETGRPEWMAVSTGMFGAQHSFVPLDGAHMQGDDVLVPYDKTKVKDAPRCSTDGHLEPDEETRLYAYYGGGDGMSGTADMTQSMRAGTTRGHDTSGPTTDDAMTRSEERMHVGRESEVAGRARVRKWIETEHQTVTVPIRREKARLVTEPITEGNVGRAMSGPDLSEEEHEVILREERPVVETEVVPVERVRLDVDEEIEERQVGADIRKERIAMEGDAQPGGTSRDI